jgi:hypothetical protein
LDQSPEACLIDESGLIEQLHSRFEDFVASLVALDPL